MLVVFLTSVCARSLVEENNEEEESAHSWRQPGVGSKSHLGPEDASILHRKLYSQHANPSDDAVVQISWDVEEGTVSLLVPVTRVLDSSSTHLILKSKPNRTLKEHDPPVEMGLLEGTFQQDVGSADIPSAHWQSILVRGYDEEYETTQSCVGEKLISFVCTHRLLLQISMTKQ